MNWPSYFQPTLSLSDPQPILPPVCVLDAFYLNDNAERPTELYAVVQTISGGLQAIRSHEWSSLAEPLQRQLRAALVSRRGALRTIQACQLLLFSLDSIEQRDMSGLNDAVLLYGRAHASLDSQLGGWEVTLLNQSGMLTVGRLDLLHGYALGFQHVWRNPESSRGFISHLFVPAGPLADVQQGRSLALVYPLFDNSETDMAGAHHHVDNTSLVMRLVYDVLLKLQQDLAGKTTGSDNLRAFATTLLPVPSLQRLEYELAAEGYEVRGNQAVRVGTPDPNAQLDVLMRLRRWAASWNAPRIALPSQAKPKDYRALIEQVLSWVANEHDQVMLLALAQRLQADAKTTLPKLGEPKPNHKSSRRAPKQKPDKPRADAPVYEATPRIDDVLSQPLPPIQPTPQIRRPKGDDWSKDFGKSNAPKPSTPEDWSSDFDADLDVSV